MIIIFLFLFILVLNRGNFVWIYLRFSGSLMFDDNSYVCSAWQV